MGFAIYSNINFSKELLNLIKEDESELLEKILEGSFLYRIADQSGATLLHYSVRYNNKCLTKYLLDKGCDVNVQTLKGNTPLMIAIMNSNGAAMEILLAAGADIFKLNSKKKSALNMLCVQYTMPIYTIQIFLQELQRKCSTYEEVAKKLLDTHCPLYLAVALKDARIIEYMIKRGSPVNSAHPMHKATAIHGAVIYDDLKSVIVLLKYGADVDARNIMGHNSLYQLYRKYSEHSYEKIEILKMLLKQGVSITSLTHRGFFDALSVLIKGNREAVALLLETGMDLNIVDDKNCKNAVHYLASNTNSGVAEELKPYIKEFNVDTYDKYGRSPLFIAAIGGNASMVQLFLEHGARTDSPYDNFGFPLIYWVCKHTTSDLENQFLKCTEMLLQYKADPQFVALNSKGKKITVFDAASKNNEQIMKCIVAHLAILEKLGTPITEMTRAKINEQDSLKKYFFKCQNVLKERIADRVVLFDLLTSDKKKMAQYLNNENIAEKLEDEQFSRKMKYYKYYYDVLSRIYLTGKRYKILKNEAAKVICKIFHNRIRTSDLITDTIVDYLNSQSLQQLCRLYH